MNKIKHFEGLRGVAALVVLFSHFKLGYFSPEFGSLIQQISCLGLPLVFKYLLINSLKLFTDGFLAVWIFWVLSSYVISIKFFRQNDNFDKILIGYFSKRYFRLLFPVLSSILFAYLLLKLGFMYNIELANLLNADHQGLLATCYMFAPSFWNAIKMGVFDTFLTYNGDVSYNPVLWTIQKEFLGSLFTFSIFGIVRHNKGRFSIYLVILLITIKLKLVWLSAFVIGHVLCDFDYSSFHYGFFQKLKNVESIIHRYHIVILISSVVIILLGKSFMSFIKLPSEYHNFIMSVFIVYICSRNNYYRNFFSRKIPYWLGNISFSLYLIHFPILCSFTSYVLVANLTIQGKFIATISTLIIVLFLSELFTKYIDKNGIIYANKIAHYFMKRN